MKRQSNSISIIPVKVSELEIKQLIAFMGALTGKSLERLGVPLSVPSGLSVD